MEVSAYPGEQSDKLHPVYLLHCQLKDKSLKRKSLENISPISLCLGRKKTVSQLIPYLTNLFAEEGTEFRQVILGSLSKLCQPLYIGRSEASCCRILEFFIDVLCIYTQPEVREQAFDCLQAVFKFLEDIKKENGSPGLVTHLLGTCETLCKSEDSSLFKNIHQLVLRTLPHAIRISKQDRKYAFQILYDHFLSRIVPDGHPDQQQSSELIRSLASTLLYYAQIVPSLDRQAVDDYIMVSIEAMLDSNDPEIYVHLVDVLLLLKTNLPLQQDAGRITLYFQRMISQILPSIKPPPNDHKQQSTGQFQGGNEEKQSVSVDKTAKNTEQLPILLAAESMQNIQKSKLVYSPVMSKIITNLETIHNAFKDPTTLQPILHMISSQFNTQTQEVKNAIIDLLDRLLQPHSINQIAEISEESVFRSILLPDSPPAGTHMRIKIGEALCHIENHQMLSQFLASPDIRKDIGFQVKIFVKLPALVETSKSVQVFESIVDNIMGNKQWRQKLLVLHHLEQNRIVQNNEDVHVLLPHLFKNLANKIACIRVATANVIARCILKRGRRILDDPLYKREFVATLQHPNWFARQAAHRVIHDVLTERVNLMSSSDNQPVKFLSDGHKQDYKKVKEACELGCKDKAVNIQTIAEQSLQLLSQIANDRII